MLLVFNIILKGPPRIITQEKATKKYKIGINLTKEVVSFCNTSQDITKRLREAGRCAELLG